MLWAIIAALSLGAALLVLVALIWSQRAKIRGALYEQRRENRIAADVPLELSVLDEPFIRERGCTLNLSCHGARVLTTTAWRPNDRVLVAVPQNPERLHARVAYCDSLSEQSFAVGLKFSSAVEIWNLDFQRSDHPFGK
jgi:PilZ domain